MPVAHGDHGVLADLLLAIQIADVPVMDPDRSAAGAALQAGGIPLAADHAAERARRSGTHPLPWWRP